MITIKNAKEIERMSFSGKIVAETLEMLADFIRPGKSTKDIDNAVENFISSRGAYPAFKGLYGFPASACVSIDQEVVHGIPKKSRILEEGMIISVDVGVRFKGYHGDAAFTYPVGKVNEDKKKLMIETWNCLLKGIEQAKPGNRIGDIASAIQAHAEKFNYGIVRELVGHGIGKKMHEDPQVPNYGIAGKGVALKSGMTIAIEPMINMGTANVKVLEDEWTYVTADGLPSAHYEHTVLIGENGPVVLTKHRLSPEQLV
jgi:methionyl aminopeptidase